MLIIIGSGWFIQLLVISPILKTDSKGFFELLACIVRVFIGFSTRIFSLFAPTPDFKQPKSEKCFKPAENLKETLATQAIELCNMSPTKL